MCKFGNWKPNACGACPLLPLSGAKKRKKKSLQNWSERFCIVGNCISSHSRGLFPRDLLEFLQKHSFSFSFPTKRGRTTSTEMRSLRSNSPLAFRPDKGRNDAAALAGAGFPVLLDILLALAAYTRRAGFTLEETEIVSVQNNEAKGGKRHLPGLLELRPAVITLGQRLRCSATVLQKRNKGRIKTNSLTTKDPFFKKIPSRTRQIESRPEISVNSH